MSFAQTYADIEYPESDGRPMGETDLHRDWMIRILELLKRRYRRQRVYVSSDILVYCCGLRKVNSSWPIVPPANGC